MAGPGMFASPGFQSIQETFENEIMWGSDHSKGMALWSSVVINGAARDATNSPTSILRPGLIMAQISDGTWKEYDADGTGGQQIAKGILSEEIRATDFDGNNIDRFYRILLRAPVKVSRLYGLDYQARSQLAKRGFLFDDLVTDIELPWAFETALADDYTLTAAESGGLFAMTAASAKTITLPAIAAGLVFRFINIGAAGLIVASAEGDNLIVGNDASADTITFSTAGEIIGAGLIVCSNAAGTKWYVQNASCPKTATIGLTATVTS